MNRVSYFVQYLFEFWFLSQVNRMAFRLSVVLVKRVCRMNRVEVLFLQLQLSLLTNVCFQMASS